MVLQHKKLVHASRIRSAFQPGIHYTVIVDGPQVAGTTLKPLEDAAAQYVTAVARNWVLAVATTGLSSVLQMCSASLAADVTNPSPSLGAVTVNSGTTQQL